MNEQDADPPDHEIKALLGSTPPLSEQDVGKQRRATINRARSSIGQRDTVMFAFVKMWTVLADLLAPIFAALSVKKNLASKPTQINKKTNNK